jgi:exodeoxyribonuclease VIII
MSDIMLDLETMGTGPDAAIVAIGAVEFSDYERRGDHFYALIDLASSVAAGGIMDPSTVRWWMQQSDHARADITGKNPLNIYMALRRFAEFAASHGSEVRIWGNGAAFDNVILRQAYIRAGIEPPWKYSNDRCYRTVAATRKDIPIIRTGTHHNALDDAISQARHIHAILRAQTTVTDPA